ncbi:MAG: F-type H+-transporting ATPase subunit b [Patescibacteria group bacterium]|jgi:F-type H+-transporting ATPase subunit b|nr:F-type H+-transporting ATPase subunit b [Patescibacteria group bacterium]
MADLFRSLGIDWRLLLSQAANFIILLIVLRAFVYAPLLRVLKERRARIEEGLAKADEADKRLIDANEMAAAKMKEAEREGLSVIADARIKAVKDKAAADEKLKIEEAAARVNLEEIMKRRRIEADAALAHEEGAIIKAAILKTVELSPDAVDDALIAQAITHVKQNRS